ncbi:MAG: hypothetical protein AAGG48_24355 [Planctomycetota bacterium]
MLFRTLTVALCLLSIQSVLHAQADPFGGPDPLGPNPFGAANPAGAAASEPTESDQSLLARQLRDYAGRGPVERATAIASSVRTGRWELADQLLGTVPGLNADTSTLSAMYREIGPALFLRMQQSDKLSDAAQAALDELAAAETAASQSAELIRQAIDGLDDPSRDTRLASTRIVIGGGNVAIAELAAAAVSEAPTAPRQILLRALIEFESVGIDSIEQLALYGDATVRHRALQALAALDRNAYASEFLSAVHAPDATDYEKQIAQRNLERLYEQVPTRPQSIELLTADFRRRQAEANNKDNDDQLTYVWTVNEDGRTVTSQPTSAMLAAYRDVADSGVRLRRMGGLSDALIGEVLSADMAYRVMVDPDWGDPDQITQIRESYGDASSAEALLTAINRATKIRDKAATVGLLRLVDAAEASDEDRKILLTSGGSKPTALVAAAVNSDPQIRYEAAVAVTRLAGTSAYAGSSLVRKTLAEMSRLGDEPTAILVETRPEVVIRIETILSRLGYDTVVVRSVAQVQRAVERGGDIRLIISKVELTDLSPIEMVDLVRRSPRGRDLPILFYGPEDPALAWRRWDAPTLLINRPSSAAAFDDVMDRVRRKRRLPALSVIDRQRYRAEAEPKPAS